MGRGALAVVATGLGGWASRYVLALFFFFQAEDGIRDYKVTGVQTCALPISFITAVWPSTDVRSRSLMASRSTVSTFGRGICEWIVEESELVSTLPARAIQIGRASCRERV